MRTLFLVIALAAAWRPALASNSSDLAKIDTKLQACMKDDASNIGMKLCTDDAFEAADKILNAAYRSIVTGLKSMPSGDSDSADNAETLKRLIASERAWISYRQNECELQGIEMLGGTGEGLVILDCLYSLTRDRVKDLDDLFAGWFQKAR